MMTLALSGLPVRILGDIAIGIFVLAWLVLMAACLLHQEPDTSLPPGHRTWQMRTLYRLVRSRWL